MQSFNLGESNRLNFRTSLKIFALAMVTTSLVLTSPAKGASSKSKIPSGYSKWKDGSEFQTSCSCDQLETIQAVKLAPSGFWTGFTAMIRHGFSHHQMSKGTTFRFEFDFDKSVVRLLVN